MQRFQECHGNDRFTPECPGSCSQLRHHLRTNYRHLLLGLRQARRLPDGGGWPAVYTGPHHLRGMHVVGSAGLLLLLDRQRSAENVRWDRTLTDLFTELLENGIKPTMSALRRILYTRQRMKYPHDGGGKTSSEIGKDRCIRNTRWELFR